MCNNLTGLEQRVFACSCVAFAFETNQFYIRQMRRDRHSVSLRNYLMSWTVSFRYQNVHCDFGSSTFKISDLLQNFTKSVTFVHMYICMHCLTVNKLPLILLCCKYSQTKNTLCVFIINNTQILQYTKHIFSLLCSQHGRPQKLIAGVTMGEIYLTRSRTAVVRKRRNIYVFPNFK